MKVVVFGSYAPSLIGFRGHLITEMIGRGHRVFAMAPDIDGRTAEGLRQLGATPVEVPLGRTSLNPFASARSLAAVRRRLAEVQADTVIAYTIKPILIGSTAARATGSRFVALVTGLGYAFLPPQGVKHRLVSRGAIWLYRRALRRAFSVIFQNPDDKQDFERLGILSRGARSAIVNGSGIDLDQFQAQPVPAEPHFLMVGRLLRAKGIREFAAAAARLKRDRPEVRIILVGWRDESPDSIGEAELDALREHLDFLGKLEDVRPALARCSVYVLPSYREGTPRSVLEAMAVGRAIITTDTPGCRETVIDGENGLLVPPRDADALYRAMLRLADDAGLRSRMGAASRRLAESKYDVREVSRAVLDHVGL